MAPPRNAAIAWSQYLAARAAETTLTTGGVDGRLRLARLIGRGLFRGLSKHRHRALEHVKQAYPDWDKRRRTRLATAAFEHLVMLAAEVCYTPRLLHGGNWSQYIRLGSVDRAVQILNSGKSAIVLTGHVGNWEVLGAMMGLLGFPLHAVARPIDNPLVNDWLLGIREKRGMKVITKWNASDRMVEVLEAGEVLGFIADQNAGERGLYVPFFGKLASTYKSIALLAITTQTPVICGAAYRVGGRFQYELDVPDVIEPSDWENQDDPVYYVTARYMRAIEMMVRRCPQQYLWMHRRWRSRPRFERQGKAMPASLRKKLEALPWDVQLD